MFGYDGQELLGFITSLTKILGAFETDNLEPDGRKKLDAITEELRNLKDGEKLDASKTVCLNYYLNKKFFVKFTIEFELAFGIKKTDKDGLRLIIADLNSQIEKINISKIRFSINSFLNDEQDTLKENVRLSSSNYTNH